MLIVCLKILQDVKLWKIILVSDSLLLISVADVGNTSFNPSLFCLDWIIIFRKNSSSVKLYFHYFWGYAMYSDCIFFNTLTSSRIFFIKKESNNFITLINDNWEFNYIIFHFCTMNPHVCIFRHHINSALNASRSACSSWCTVYAREVVGDLGNSVRHRFHWCAHWLKRNDSLCSLCTLCMKRNAPTICSPSHGLCIYTVGSLLILSLLLWEPIMISYTNIPSRGKRTNLIAWNYWTC